MTSVVHCKKARYDIYIGRPSIWGNPFSHLPNTLARFKVSSREEAIKQYKIHFYEKIKEESFRERVLLLKDKVLGCFCHPLPCHGDVIAEYLNSL